MTKNVWKLLPPFVRRQWEKPSLSALPTRKEVQIGHVRTERHLTINEPFNNTFPTLYKGTYNSHKELPLGIRYLIRDSKASSPRNKQTTLQLESKLLVANAKCVQAIILELLGYDVLRAGTQEHAPGTWRSEDWYPTTRPPVATVQKFVRWLFTVKASNHHKQRSLFFIHYTYIRTRKIYWLWSLQVILAVDCVG